MNHAPRDRSAGEAAGRATPFPVGSLLALFAAALLVRIVYLLQIRGNPTFLHPTADPLSYHERALEILSGHWLGSAVFFHSSPIYPYFLAANYFVNGHSIFWTYAAQAAVDALGVILLFKLARRLAGRTIAWGAGIFALGYQAFIFFTGELLEITLVLTCLTGALLLLVASSASWRENPGPPTPTHAGRGASRRAKVHSSRPLFGAGLLLGLAVLGKPNLLAAVPLLLVGWNVQAGRPWRTLGRPWATCILGLAIVILPVTLRNLAVAGDWVLTTSNGGINFYIGNNPDADGTFSVSAAMQGDLEISSAHMAERVVGRPLRPSQVSAFWLRQGLDFVFDHPGRALALTGRKLLLFLNGYEIPNHFDIRFFQRYSWLLHLTPFRFAFLLPLALAGLAFAWPRRRQLAILYLLLAGTVLSLLPFFITDRYRLPAVPTLLVFAAFGLGGLVKLAAGRGEHPPRWLQSLPGGNRVGLVAGLLAGAALASLPLNRPEGFYAHQYGAIASVYKEQGRMREAAEEYRRAIALAPGGVLLRNSLAVCLVETGDAAAGEEMIRSALAIDPLYAPAWRNLGRLLEARGDTLGAIAAQRRAFEADPYLAPAGVDLARLLFARQAYAETERVLRDVLVRSPRDANALWNLAVLLGTRLERPGDALLVIDRLLAAHPTHPEARRLQLFLKSHAGTEGP
ncbi:MAG: tetratricopeptide repeat protein [Candidatus Eisenbacteria bacterium]